MKSLTVFFVIVLISGTFSINIDVDSIFDIIGDIDFGEIFNNLPPMPLDESAILKSMGSYACDPKNCDGTTCQQEMLCLMYCKKQLQVSGACQRGSCVCDLTEIL